MLGRTVADGRYRLKRLIGTGGTADVYEADDNRLHRTVAVKLLHPRLLEDGVLAARLQAEVHISRTLSHHGIVEVYDYSVEDAESERAYIVMEYMAGGDLRRRLLSIGHLPGGEVSRIAGSLLAALRVAHERGVVHRDLKPRNVLFAADGAPKIADFGLARSVSAAGLFQKGTIVGTPEYTAPESITSSLWDARSDLYALGCTLYEALRGEPPFSANTPAEVLRNQVETEPPALPADLVSGYPQLASLVAALLRKDPNDRPQTAAEADGLLSGGKAWPVAAPAATGACPSCGAPLSGHYQWCFTCGRANLPVRRVRTGYTVLVTGPGKSGEKTSPEFRDACCDVAAAAGLDPSPMQKKVPRLPFVVARQVDYGGAVRLSDELRSCGAEVTLVGRGEASGGQFLRTIGRKALTMAPRVYVVMLGMGGAWFNIVRSVPPTALLIGFGGLLAAVPAALMISFAGAMGRWRKETARTEGENITRLLATVRDPLIHARMKSMTESVRSLAGDAVADPTLSDVERRSILSWADEVVERTAGLCLGLDAARASRTYSQAALDPPAGESGHVVRVSSRDPEAKAAADLLRDVDAIYTRTLELIGRSALEVRELGLRFARVGRSKAARELGELTSIMARFADEGTAWREIRELEGAGGG